MSLLETLDNFAPQRPPSGYEILAAVTRDQCPAEELIQFVFSDGRRRFVTRAVLRALEERESIAGGAEPRHVPLNQIGT